MNVRQECEIDVRDVDFVCAFSLLMHLSITFLQI